MSSIKVKENNTLLFKNWCELQTQFDDPYDYQKYLVPMDGGKSQFCT